MANDNNIQQFSAVDIEKYHQGKLSPKERHALEKAALDDPFLADALEGYAVSGVDAVADIADLKTRLAERTTTAKVIPLGTGRRDSFRMLRAAAVIVFIAGAGLLVYQFGFNKKNNNIAQAKETSAAKEKPAVADTNVTAPATVTNNNQIRTEPTVNTPSVASTDKGTTSKIETTVPGEAKTAPPIITSDVAPVASTTTPSVAPPAKTLAKEDAIASTKKADDKDGIKDEAKKRSAGAEAKQEKEVLAKRSQQESNEQVNRAVTTNRNAEPQNRYQQANIFRGRVTDAENNGVPFANVTNAQDNNAGTYTDAKGFFNLTSPDTMLNVEVRSIGFENSQVQLRNSIPNNQVVLQDDRRSLSEVVVSSQKPNAAARSNTNNIKMEEPEPADGWEKYDSYLANNLKAPEDFKPKQSNTPLGAVEVSFEVDKNGEPVNFKIEKSLCATCDKEAIRLIKEGPKWKQKAKKGRTTVKINF